MTRRKSRSSLTPVDECNRDFATFRQRLASVADPATNVASPLKHEFTAGRRPALSHHAKSCILTRMPGDARLVAIAIVHLMEVPMRSMAFFAMILVFASLTLLAQSNPVPLIYQPLIPAHITPGHASFALTVHWH